MISIVLKIKVLIYKLTHWEFWNSNFVYSIPTIYFLYLAIKARSIGFFSAANPNITNGGFGMESKFDIYQSMPNHLYPTTIFYKANEPIQPVFEQITQLGIAFPLIVKPDIGFQGKRVEKMNNRDELTHYLSNADFNVLVQALINYPNEIGVFYCRYPEHEKGFISGVVYKEYPSVVGDGKNTIYQLIKQNIRLYSQKELFNLSDSLYNTILEKDEHYQLSSIGNHARGSKFIDMTNQVTPELVHQMDLICKAVPAFYFGRVDLKYHTLEELGKGQNFSIIEVNGAASLPTHMYDPKHSLLFAWKEMIKHYRILFQISKSNQKAGHAYLPFTKVVEMVKLHLQMVKKLN